MSEAGVFLFGILDSSTVVGLIGNPVSVTPLLTTQSLVMDICGTNSVIVCASFSDNNYYFG